MERSSYTSEIPIFEIPGGIHPAEHKLQSNQSPISTLTLAKELVINLKGQAGNRSIPVVEVGEQVLKGQVIAKSDGVFSSYQHAPTSGVIIAIEKRPIAHASGLTDLCIVLKGDDQDNWCQLEPCPDYQSISRETLLAKLLEHGIVGLGGASFPSHIKLQRQSGVHTLIINAAECEPYISCDDRLLQESAKEVLQGAQIICQLYSELKVIVGIEDNKPKAIEALVAARDSLKMDNLQIGVVPTKYPSGGEKQLIQLLTGQEVPKGKLPADLGLIMHNVGTCFAIYEAIVLGKPLVERLVTLTGEACQQPGNYRIPLGTPFAHLLAVTQGEKADTVIMGGPMMGFEVQELNAGIVKATNCVIMAAPKELAQQRQELACIRCGACMDACPASLLPQQLYWHAKSDEFDKTEEYDLFDCIECGACAYVCP
ncbi:MAG: electron transport complex subunit RsxC, partial [Gammaproteobacteria bacterium]|nr:electron transport complex subunit RsxC [Gammaproteobacteria bacterium]